MDFSLCGWKPFSRRRASAQTQPVNIPSPPHELTQLAPAPSSIQATVPPPPAEDITPPQDAPIVSSPEIVAPPKIAPPLPTMYPAPKIDDPQPNAGPIEVVDPLDIKKIRELCPDFTILVMGRANSGKTTIIQRMCDTNEDPIVHDEEGNELLASILQNPDPMRGHHNIRLTITYESKPGFKFHDSMGFEAGSPNEVQTVKDFIQEKLKETQLRNRLHAIWYCIPIDYNRVASEAELSFFNQNTGDIPVILLFTKWDGQIIKACNTLRYEQDMGIVEAMKEAPHLARRILETEYIPVFKRTPYPPTSYTVLGYMNNPETKCGELVEKTAAALKNSVLKKLFVSVQTHNIQLCIENGIKEVVSKAIFSSSSETGLNHERVILLVLSWFPHMFTVNHDYSYDGHRETTLDQTDDFRSVAQQFQPVFSGSTQAFTSLRLQYLNNAAAAAIVGTRSFGMDHHSWDATNASLKTCVEKYLSSPQCSAVQAAIASKFDQYKDSSTLNHPEEIRKQISEELTQVCLGNLLR